MKNIPDTSESSLSLSALRQTIRAHKHVNENDLIEQLLITPVLTKHERDSVLGSAKTLVAACRQDSHNHSLLDSFLQEFGLSNNEGVALMCLAEALLRVPDNLTADRLIAEKIAEGNWRSHSGKSDSLFVNSATWGMILTGQLVQLDERIVQQPDNWVRSLTSKLSEPVVRAAVKAAMRFMGSQYVLGRSIAEGLENADKQAQKLPKQTLRFSFDMLGEGARTLTDAQRYYHAYADAFDYIGAQNQCNNVYDANGISVKLSALHPLYHAAHAPTVMQELLPLIKALCVKAKAAGLGLSIDAEEAARLEISLDIFAALASDADLADWDGLGFVLQAYQKRALTVAQWLVQLAKQNQRRLMVRLVKGAYWDSEIKLAQENGYADYPVFTRKANTDFCYMKCADILLNNPDAIYAQFATHNATTAASIMQLAQRANNADYEFQRLHGMGELMYAQLHKMHAEQPFALRVYAPIGQHQDLLPYLVRRLLENGANSSFVNRFLDNAMPIDELVTDLYQQVQNATPYRHAQIPTPQDIFYHAGENRQNALGLDLDDADIIQNINQAIAQAQATHYLGHSMIAGVDAVSDSIEVRSPIDAERVIGSRSPINPAMLETALDNAEQARAAWAASSAEHRAQILNNTADALERDIYPLVALINQEAGRTLGDCVSEVREAVDFCRYYALQMTLQESSQALPNDPRLTPRGTFFCISPWNFPLAIFVGQVSAALAAGNCVLAKPADQTPLIAAAAVRLFHQSGCPVEVLQLLVGEGAMIGDALLPDPRLHGVAFTGSTRVAKLINTHLSARNGATIALIAETGGQNCMVVDSTALPEQVVDDVIASAFHSAGQRCSALRVLYLQDVVADTILTMLAGALECVHLGDPSLIATDVGPVIDRVALDKLQDHIDRMQTQCRPCGQVKSPTANTASGHYFAPRVLEIDSIAQLQDEVFGPVLHVIRYSMHQLDKVIDEINSTGYGLTFGVHSRIASFADYLCANTRAGNNYINRTTIGAVVGVNPFGGQGLSGTGPKAGGRYYLNRLQNHLAVPHKNDSKALNAPLKTQTVEMLNACFGNNHYAQPNHKTHLDAPHDLLSSALQNSALLDSTLVDKSVDKSADKSTAIAQICTVVARHLNDTQHLPGPTGEQNTLKLYPKGEVVLAVSKDDEFEQLLAMSCLAIAAGNRLLILNLEDSPMPLLDSLLQFFESAKLHHAVQIIDNTAAPAVLCLRAGNPYTQSLRTLLATYAGRINMVFEFDHGIFSANTTLAYLSALTIERTTTDNLVARGGNTQLFNL